MPESVVATFADPCVQPPFQRGPWGLLNSFVFGVSCITGERAEPEGPAAG